MQNDNFIDRTDRTDLCRMADDGCPNAGADSNTGDVPDPDATR